MTDLTAPLRALDLEPWPDPDPLKLEGRVPEPLLEGLFRAFRSGDEALTGEAMLDVADTYLRSYRYDAALLWMVRCCPHIGGANPSYQYERTMANIARRLGHPPTALSAAKKALRAARDGGLQRAEAAALSLRGAVHAAAGHFDESGKDLEQAIEAYRRMKVRPGEAEATLRAADRLLRMEDRYRAVDLAKAGLDLVGDGGTPSLVAKGAYLVGKCRMALEDWEKALRALEFSAGLAKEHESRELFWHAQAARARTLEKLYIKNEAAEVQAEAKEQVEAIALNIRQVPVRERFLARPDVQAFLIRTRKA